jgi:hypothetical protein
MKNLHRGNVRPGLDSRLAFYLAPILLLSTQLMGCAVVKGIFKAGVWVGVLSVFAVIGLIIFGVTKLAKRT